MQICEHSSAHAPRARALAFMVSTTRILQDKGMAADEFDDRTVADLLMEQVGSKRYKQDTGFLRRQHRIVGVACMCVAMEHCWLGYASPLLICKIFGYASPFCLFAKKIVPQVEFANLLVLNKVDTVSEEQVRMFASCCMCMAQLSGLVGSVPLCV